MPKFATDCPIYRLAEADCRVIRSSVTLNSHESRLLEPVWDGSTTDWLKSIIPGRLGAESNIICNSS